MKENSKQPVVEKLIELTKKLWHYYLLEPTSDHLNDFQKYLADDLTVIGTGRSELYNSLEDFMQDFKNNLAASQHLFFEMLDEWYECVTVSKDVYLVYGGICIQSVSEDKSLTYFTMDTRFSVIYRPKGESFEIVHLHHSVPSTEQLPGEFFPKTLSEEKLEADNLIRELTKKVEYDLMTEVLNHAAFTKHAAERMKTTDGMLFMFDFDYFKHINDTYGHLTGDEILTAFSKALENSFDAEALIGRLGGDEFVVYAGGDLTDEECQKFINRVKAEFKVKISGRIPDENRATFSVGVANSDRYSSYKEVLARADKALYESKKTKDHMTVFRF